MDHTLARTRKEILTEMIGNEDYHDMIFNALEEAGCLASLGEDKYCFMWEVPMKDYKDNELLSELMQAFPEPE